MVGRTILQYRITEKLGEGGMGVVYKAEDTQLRRTVALKFLPRETLDEEEVKARLLREAQAAASLDHPNICQVFGIHEEDGETFIAMAYIDGPSLAEKIKERPLPLDESLTIATQIAEGLHEAHEHGVVHRDIKPQNILLTAKGQVKILDFGLAALTGRSKLTKTGTTMGTPAYMAPEQLEGRKVDRRVDVWALGCVLYEMLTQKSPFEADYEQAIGYGILNEDPEPVTALRRGLPPKVDDLLAKALAKDRDERYQHADDLLADLRVLQKQSSGARKTSSGRSTIAATTGRAVSATDALPPGAVVVQQSRQRIERVLAAVLGVALLGVSYAYFTAPASEPPEQTVTRFSFAPEGLRVTDFSAGASISPDGKNVLYAAQTDGESSLWLRSLSNESARELPGTAGASEGFWSPDSLSIGFAIGNELKRVPINGGDPITLCQLPGASFLGGTWSPNGERIVFSSGARLYEIAARGGEPEMLFEPGEGQRRNYWRPHFLPADGGSHGLAYVAAVNATDQMLTVMDMETGERRELGPGSRPGYSSEGYLIHGPMSHEEAGLRAMPFSLDSLEATGQSFPIDETGRFASVSLDGTLVYTDYPTGGGHQLVIRDRSGEILQSVDSPLGGQQPRPAVAPDGRSVAFQVGGDIWVYDLDRSVRTRLTSSGDSTESSAFWPSSSEELSYASRGDQGYRVMSQVADGSVASRTLLETTRNLGTLDWSSDGQYLVYNATPGPDSPEGEEGGIWYHERGPDGSLSEATPFLLTPDGENAPQFSPNGRFVAYTSNESGQFEVYVRPFPPAPGKWQVSTAGGIVATWSADGRELFYVEQAGVAALMAVSVSTQAGFVSEEPTRLFESPDLRGGTARRHYDVFPDGQRFVTSGGVQTSDGEAPQTIRIVQNWYEEFRAREQ